MNGKYIEMSIDEGSTICRIVSEVIEKPFVCCYAEPMYWQSSLAKVKAKWSLHHSQNERQWSDNYVWLCILGNLSGDWLQTSIN